jgi:dihydrofolate reductase
MGKVIVMNGLSLDGEMQGPGRPDEDTRDGFAHGGWAAPYSDEAMVAKMGERMGAGRAFLFGRRTYEDLLTSWNAQGGPFKEALNNARKYVASSSPSTRLDWPNSTLLHGDIPAAVADLKESSGTNGRRSDRRVPAHDPSSGARHRAAAVRRQRTNIAAAGRQHRHEHWRVDRHVRACSRIETRRVGRSMRTASRDGSPIPDPSESVSADPAAPAFARSSFQHHPVAATRSHCRSTTQNTCPPPPPICSARSPRLEWPPASMRSIPQT